MVIINVIVTLVVVFAVISIINSQNLNQPANQIVITVPILITSTRDPDLTESVRIVTATPLAGTPGVVSLPTGLLPELGETFIAPTIDPALLESSSALQETATALPANCILHTVVDGDTPFGIAEEYGIDGNDLMAVNGLDETTASFMQIGDVLIVPLEGCELTAQALQPVDSATGAVAAHTEAVATLDGTPPTATEPPTRAATATRTPTATLPATATDAQVEIVRVLSPGDINAEGVDIRNNGAVVDLTDWELSAASGETYTFPQQRVFTGGVLTIYTRVGSDTPQAKFWGLDTALWDSGTTLTLTDASGDVQSTYIVP
ncbi:MAG: lamin tail domain-containing protein [Chloroflexota bacterium]